MADHAAIDLEISEIQNSDAITQDNHPDYHKATDRLNVLFQTKYDGVESLTKHQKEMAEFEEHGRFLPRGDPEGRIVADSDQRHEILNPDGTKFSWSQEVDPENTVDKNPESYRLNTDNLTSRQDELDAVETDQGLIEFLGKEGVELDASDVRNMERLHDLGSTLGMDDTEIRGAFESVIRSPDFRRTFSMEEGLDRLTSHYCQGDRALAESIAQRAYEVIQQGDPRLAAYLEETQLGNSPNVMIAISNLHTDGMGSSLDDPTSMDLGGDE